MGAHDVLPMSNLVCYCLDLSLFPPVQTPSVHEYHSYNADGYMAVMLTSQKVVGSIINVAWLMVNNMMNDGS